MRDSDGMQITSWKFVCDKDVPNSATFEIAIGGDVKEVHLGSQGNMKAIVACALYSSCSVSMILVNKSLASR